MYTSADGSTADIQAEEVSLVEARDKQAVAQGNGSQAAQMDGSAGNLLNAAGSGFKLDPHAAATLAAACQEAMDQIRDMREDLRVISEAPQLGTLQGAHVVATYTQNVATDPQGMIKAVNSLYATLHQMHDAYIQASRNYQETNEQVADILSRLDDGQSAAPSSSAPTAPPNAGSPQHFTAS